MSKKKLVGDIKREENSEVVTFAAQADEAPLEVTTPTGKETVIIKPPADGEMKEVSAEEFMARRGPAVGTPTSTLSSTIRDLIGKPLQEVRASLEELKKQQKIKDFKIIPLGTPLTTQAVPGRVQVIKDHADNVLDIVLG
jgi:hypothetical protein